MKRYMVIERFSPDNLDAIYLRLEKQGRGLPDGLLFVDSWLTADNSCVFQLMETDNEALLSEWMEFWSDLVSFEYVELREKPGAGR